MFLATTTAANGGVMSTGMLIMWLVIMFGMMYFLMIRPCLLYTSDAADEL